MTRPVERFECRTCRLNFCCTAPRRRGTNSIKTDARGRCSPRRCSHEIEVRMSDRVLASPAARIHRDAQPRRQRKRRHGLIGRAARRAGAADSTRGPRGRVRGQAGLLCGDGSETSCSRPPISRSSKPPGGCISRGLLAHAAAPQAIVARAGRALAGGCGLATACDLILATKSASSVRRCNAAFARDRHDDAAAPGVRRSPSIWRRPVD